MKKETATLAREMYEVMNGKQLENPSEFIEKTIMKGFNMTSEGDMMQNGIMVAHVEKRPDYKGKSQSTVWSAADWKQYRHFESCLSAAQNNKSLVSFYHAEKAIENIEDGTKANRLKRELDDFFEHEHVIEWKPDGVPSGKSEPTPPPTPKKDDGTHNGMTWKERAEVGLKIAKESNGRIIAEWKGRCVETAWLWLRGAEEGTNPFTKAETKLLKYRGGAGFHYKKYGEDSQYKDGTVMWYLPYPNTRRHRIGKGHNQYTTFGADENEEEAA